MIDRLTKYRNMYLEAIHRYINKISGEPDHKIYEYLYALELGFINWDDLPPDFDEQFDVPHRLDYGVDLVDLDYEMACQVKKYEYNTITLTHLSKFITYASDVLDIHDGNIILATTKSAKIDKLGEAKLIDTGKIQLLRNDFDELIEKYSKIKPKKMIKVHKAGHIQKRDYLVECYNTIISTDTKVKCQLPCGCGKTYIILYTIQQELKQDNSLKFIIFVPWLDLANQTQELCKHYNIDTVFIGDGCTEIKGEYNIIICVNPSVIHISSKIKFRYKFIDEAHHLESSDSKLKEKIDKIKSDKEIHFSATFYDTSNLHYNYPLRSAIDSGWVSDYVLHFSFFNTTSRMEAMINMLKDKRNYFPMFIYFNSTDRCKEFYDKAKVAKISADYLDGSSSTTKRKDVKSRLISGKLDVLSLRGVYNEGVSIDNIKTVMFGDLRHSDINKIQIMMRASRLHSSKPFYRVIIPATENDMNSDDMKEIVQTFCKIDPDMKKSIERKSKTRIRIDGIDMTDVEKAELQYERIYNSLGDFISGKSCEERWYDNLEKVKEFIDAERKRPSQYSKNQDEKFLGLWICNQLHTYNKKTNIMSDKKIRECWEKLVSDEKYKKYIMSNEDVWYDNLEKVKKFIDTESKRPNINGKNKDEKFLGSWIGTQSTNYNKKSNIMKDEKIQKCWKKFVSDEKYKKYFMSNYEAWHDNVGKVKKFIDTENKRPSCTSKNQDEKYLGSWIRTQFNNYNKKTHIMKDKKIQEYWEKFVGDKKYKEYLMLNDDVWYDNLEKVKKFIDTENKRPPRISKNHDEKYLGAWINAQLNNYNKKTRIMSDKKIQECWEKFVGDEKYTEYFMSNDDAWYDNLEKVKKFIDKENKRPANSSKNQDEKYLGAWINTQLTNYNKKTQIMNDKKIRESWKKFVGDEKYKEYFMENDNAWYDNLEKVKKFIDAENKRPSSSSKNYDEKYLGRWIQHQSKNYKKKTERMSNKKIQESWKKFVGDEKYKEYFMSNDDAWYDNLEKVKKFIDAENKRPLTCSKNQDEKYLGLWIQHQSTGYNKKIDIMKDKKIQESWEKFVGDEKYKEYFMANEEVWYDNLEKVKKFIDTENKRPTQCSNNQNEKYLGAWIQTQSAGYNKKTYIMKDEKIYKSWETFVGDEKYKEYFMSNNEVWYDNLEKVKKFIDTENKRPSSISKNQDEKSLGLWICNQLTKYNKQTGIMKDEKIYEYWKKFISNKKYKEYFM
jgi:superfamily II DNA or RNA helicase